MRWWLRLLPQNGEAADGTAEGGAHKDVGGEVRRQAEAGKADHGCEAKGCVGDPAVVAVLTGDYGGYGKCGDGVTGRPRGELKPGLSAGRRPER